MDQTSALVDSGVASRRIHVVRLVYGDDPTSIPGHGQGNMERCPMALVAVIASH